MLKCGAIAGHKARHRGKERTPGSRVGTPFCVFRIQVPGVDPRDPVGDIAGAGPYPRPHRSVGVPRGLAGAG